MELFIVLFAIGFFIFLTVSIIKDHIETNKVIRESEESAKRVEARIQQLLKKERKYDAIMKRRRGKLPNGAYGGQT